MRNKIKILGLLLIITACSTQEEPIEHIIREPRYLMDRNDVERALEGGTWVVGDGVHYQFSYDAVKGKWKKAIYHHDSGAIRIVVEESYEVKQDLWGTGKHWFDYQEGVLPLLLLEIAEKDNNTYEQYLRANTSKPLPDGKELINYIRICEVTGNTPIPVPWKRKY